MTTPRRGRISDNVRVLHNALTNILNDEDRGFFIRSLNQYQKDRDVIELVDSLKRVLDSPRKRQVYPLLRDIIPSNDKRYFMKIWHASQGQTLNSSKEWSTTSTTRSRSQSRPLEPLQRSHIHCSLPENLDKYDSGIDISNMKSCSSRASQKYPIRRLYLKRVQGTGFGFSMRGGSEHGVGLYVSSVDENSLAEYEGLLSGDHILSVNEIQFDGLSHDQAVKIIKNNKKLNMVVRSVGRIPNTFVAEATYKWIDPMGQRVSPPPNVDSNGRVMSTDGIHRSDLRLLGDDDERKINILIEDGVKLGLKIRGGSEYGLGIYIAGIDPNSAADKAGLKVGDQIMDVNGVSFLNISHKNAVKVLKSAKHMMVTMKDVGRLPFAKTMTDKTNWTKGKPKTYLQSDTESISTSVQIHALPTTFQERRNTTAGTTRFERRSEDSKFRQGIAGSQLMYNGTGPLTKNLSEDQARQVLNENEFGTLSYYLEEYRKGFIAVDALVLALFSLLDTPAKVSLLTEVRGSISPKDIDRFDDLVLKREIDAMKRRKIGASSHEDAQSIRSYSSSVSSYSAQSSSSKSSARDSHHGTDSRPITPPRVPEILPSNLKYDQNNSSLELSSMIPLASSSPRNSKQSMTNGETTKYLAVGNNDRSIEDVTTNKDHEGSPCNGRSPETSGKKVQVKKESPSPITFSSEVPTEGTKKEKRTFSLFPHSKSKGSYSPNKQFTDHSITNSEVLPLKRSSDKRSNQNQFPSDGTDGVRDSDLGVRQEPRTLLNQSKKESNKDVEKKISLSVSVNEKTKSSGTDVSTTKTESSHKEHLLRPIPQQPVPQTIKMDSEHLKGNQVKIDSKGALSAFAPPKPPRSFHLLDDYTANNDKVRENSEKPKENGREKNDISTDETIDVITDVKEDFSSVFSPKPTSIYSVAQEQTSKTNISSHRHLDPHVYVDIDGMDSIASSPKSNPPMPSSEKVTLNSQSIVRTHNEYVDIDITKTALSPPLTPKPYSSNVKERTADKCLDATSTGSDKINVIAQKQIRDLSFESLEIPNEENWLKSSQLHSESSERLKSSGEKASTIPPDKPSPYSPNKDGVDGDFGKHHISGQRLGNADKKSSTSPLKPPPYKPKTENNRDRVFLSMDASTTDRSGSERSTPPSKPPPYKPKTENGRDGMFLAMDASTTDRSGLERSTCWGDESTPSGNTSLYSVVNIFPRRTLNTSDPSKTHNHVTSPEQDISKKSTSADFKKEVRTQKSSTKETTRNDKGVNDSEAKPTVISKVRPQAKTSSDENQNVIKEFPSGSMVRNMINAYNHMSDENANNGDKHITTNQKSTNRKSWDGVHNPPFSDESRKISSLENKRRSKSNSDSNLMNLPKDQQKDIQVKLKASQELFDLRQHTKSRESSNNNSPRHSIDIGQHPKNPTSDADHLVGYEVHIDKAGNGLGMALEGGSDTASYDEPIKIKSVKKGPYAAYLSGKLRAGQEVIQINKTPLQGMTNAMATLALRQTYADTETKTVTLVVKDA